MPIANDADLSSLPFNHLDNAFFNTVLYELSHGPLNYDTKRLNSLLFNPTDQSKSSDFNTSQLDPDRNFSFSSTSGNYFEDEINAKASTEHYNPNFSVLHLNARSLIRNFDKFKFLLGRLQKPLEKFPHSPIH